jgi:hypothetical protein
MVTLAGPEYSAIGRIGIDRVRTHYEDFEKTVYSVTDKL